MQTAEKARIFPLRRLAAGAAAVALGAAAWGASPPEPDGPSGDEDRPRWAFQRGVSWVAGPKQVTREHLLPLREQHVDWIVQTPFGWQKSIHTPTVHVVADDERVWWGERDVGIETTARLARELGIRTLLKPHIWLTSYDGTWRGQIAMQDEAAWKAWFESYQAFILHYARLAERTGIDALCIGTELHATTVARPDDWRKLIAEVRKVFGGQLTYAANWNQEFEEVAFWPALDFIGIQAYFPLSEKERPSVEDLVQGWRPHVEAIERVHRRFGKPVVFTEVGYRSTGDAAIRPWEWPQREMAERSHPETQANGYEAFFRTFWERDWLAGVYWWKWYPEAGGRRGRRSIGFTPQGKPAQKVMADWYGRPRPGAAVTGE